MRKFFLVELNMGTHQLGKHKGRGWRSTRMYAQEPDTKTAEKRATATTAGSSHDTRGENAYKWSHDRAATVQRHPSCQIP